MGPGWSAPAGAGAQRVRGGLGSGLRTLVPARLPAAGGSNQKEPRQPHCTPRGGGTRATGPTAPKSLHIQPAFCPPPVSLHPGLYFQSVPKMFLPSSQLAQTTPAPVCTGRSQFTSPAARPRERGKRPGTRAFSGDSLFGEALHTHACLSQKTFPARPPATCPVPPQGAATPRAARPGAAQFGAKTFPRPPRCSPAPTNRRALTPQPPPTVTRPALTARSGLRGRAEPGRASRHVSGVT